MWIVFLVLCSVLGNNLPTRSPSGVPSHRPSQSPTTGSPTSSPTPDPTMPPTPQWGAWGDCVPCTSISEGPSFDHLEYNVCGCRESNRTCDMSISAYNCTEEGFERKVAGCDIDGLSYEISCAPTRKPTWRPSVGPTFSPSDIPTVAPSSLSPTQTPTEHPTTRDPTTAPTLSPTVNTTGEAVLNLIIVYHGWPPSRNVFESLHPLASTIDVISLDQMDIKQWNYTDTEPNIMNVTYEFFLLSWRIEKEVVALLNDVMFAESLVTKILEYWNDDYVSLTIEDYNVGSSAQISDKIMAAWTIGFISFGIFILCNTAIVIFVALFREKKKREFKEFKMQQMVLSGVKVRRSTIALLNSSPREQWESGNISIERFGTTQRLSGFIDSPVIVSNIPISVFDEKIDDLEEGDRAYEGHRKSTKHFSTISLKSSPDSAVHTYNIHDDGGSQAAHSPRSRKKSTFIRDESRALRKSVFHSMKYKSNSSVASLGVHSPRFDQDGDVSVNVRTRISSFETPRFESSASLANDEPEPELGEVHHSFRF